MGQSVHPNVHLLMNGLTTVVIHTEEYYSVTNVYQIHISIWMEIVWN